MPLDDFTLSSDAALFWMSIAVSVSLVVQSFELFSLKRRLDLVWLGPKSKAFWFLVKSRLFALVLLFFVPGFFVPLFLFVSSFWICVLLGGKFNGGSDSMTLIVLLGLTFAQVDHPLAIRFGMVFVAIQAASSYFVAGSSKASKKSWWNGSALQNYIERSSYPIPDWIQSLFLRFTALAMLSSMAVITFEVLFLGVFISTEMALFMCSLAFLFHLGNFLVFGLNRFVWAWAASYPALIYVTGSY